MVCARRLTAWPPHAVAHLWVSIRKTENDATGGIDNDGAKMMMNAGKKKLLWCMTHDEDDDEDEDEDEDEDPGAGELGGAERKGSSLGRGAR